MFNHKIIRLKDVKELTSLSESSIWRREQEGKFPIRRHLGGRAVGWFFDEITQWLENTECKKTIPSASQSLSEHQ
jgi:prophage regulatory protein